MANFQDEDALNEIGLSKTVKFDNKDALAEIGLNKDNGSSDPIAAINKKSGQQMIDEMATGTDALGAGVGQGLTNVVRGGVQVGKAVGEAVGALPEGTTAAYTKEQDAARKLQSEELAKKYPNNPGALAVGKFAGEVAPAIAMPVGAGAGLVGRMAIGAAGQGAVGAAAYVPEGDSRLKNTAIGAAAGAVAPLLNKAIEGAKGLFTGRKEAIANKATEILDSVPKDVKEASKATGINISPAQVATETQQKAVSMMNPTTKVKGQAEEFLKTQQKQVNDSISKIVDDLTPEGRTAAAQMRDDLYQKLETTPTPPETMDIILGNPLLKSQYAKATQDPAFLQATQGLERNSVGYMDKFKQYIDNSSRLEGSFKKGFDDARNTLVDALDNAAPEYKLARNLHTRLKLQDDVESKLASIRTGTEIPEVSQVHNTLFGTPQKINDLRQSVVSALGNGAEGKAVVNQINDVAKLTQYISSDKSLKGLMNKQAAPTTMEALKAPTNWSLGALLGSGGAGVGAIAAGPLGGAAGAITGAMTNKAFSAVSAGYKNALNDGVVKAMIDPKYADKISAIAKMPKPQAAAKFGALLSTISRGQDPQAQPVPEQKNRENINKLLDDAYTKPLPETKQYLPEKQQQSLINNPTAPLAKTLQQESQFKDIKAGVPKEKQDAVVALASMNSEDFYNEVLNTKEKRMQYLKGLKAIGGDVAGTALKLKQLDKLEAEHKQAQASNKPLAPEQRNRTKQMLMALVGGLFFGLPGLMMGFLGGEAAANKKAKATAKENEKISNKRTKAEEAYKKKKMSQLDFILSKMTKAVQARQKKMGGDSTEATSDKEIPEIDDAEQ